MRLVDGFDYGCIAGAWQSERQPRAEPKAAKERLHPCGTSCGIFKILLLFRMVLSLESPNM